MQALYEIEAVASRRKDCDVSEMSSCTKIDNLASAAIPAARGDAFRLLVTVRDVARANIAATSRMDAIAALCAQARKVEAVS